MAAIALTTGAIAGLALQAYFSLRKKRAEAAQLSLLRKYSLERQQIERKCKVTLHYRVDNSQLRASTDGLGYRTCKQLDKLDTNEEEQATCAPWGTHVAGVDEGDGWVRVGDRYLPVELRGYPVLVLAEVSSECPAGGLKSNLRRVSSSCSTGLGLDDQSRQSVVESESEPEAVEAVDGSDSEASKLSLRAAAHCIGKDDGCEDAFFVTSFGLGVADGVGSMAKFTKHGVDAAAFAGQLMEFAEGALRSAKDDGRTGTSEGTCMDAMEAIKVAESKVTAYGASTITVMHLQGEKVNIASLGDSGCMLLRKGETGMQIIARTREQQHEWNYPFQLERLPPALQLLLQEHCPDSPADCERLEFEVTPGDLVLLYTDGCSDNLFEEEMLQLVDHVVEKDGVLTSPVAIARELARAAYKKSRDRFARTPFGESAWKEGYQHYGGKLDDITVAAAWVTAKSVNVP